jgi:hypothetical protein
MIFVALHKLTYTVYCVAKYQFNMVFVFNLKQTEIVFKFDQHKGHYKCCVLILSVIS